MSAMSHSFDPVSNHFTTSSLTTSCMFGFSFFCISLCGLAFISQYMHKDGLMPFNSVMDHPIAFFCSFRIPTNLAFWSKVRSDVMIVRRVSLNGPSPSRDEKGDLRPLLGDVRERRRSSCGNASTHS